MSLSTEEAGATLRAGEVAWPFGSGVGEMRLWVPAPRIIVITMFGRGDAATMPAFKKAVPPPPSDGNKQTVFVEMFKLEHYESGLRTGLTEWVNQRRAHVAKVHCLFRSKMVAMGVSVANLALGGLITTHTARASFNAAFDRALGA